MKNKIKILYLDILTGNSEVRKEINTKVYKGSNYSESTRKAFSLAPEEWVTCEASGGKFPDDLSSFDGVVIGGSTEDPIAGQEKPWMKDTYGFIRRVIKKGIPMLGICGGLQFVVRALGKKIIVNPKGKEQGTLPLELTKGGGEDLLFRGLPKKFPVQLTHKVMASELKDEWKILASSKLCRVQALAIGDKIRLTQFHPEMGANELRLITKMRKDKLISAGIFKNNKEFNLFLSSIVDTKKMSRQILKNFLNYFVLPYKTKKL